MAQFDIAQVDRDLLTIRSLGPKFVYIVGHRYPPDGWWVEGDGSEFKPYQS
jgi:hypothetical protein